MTDIVDRDKRSEMMSRIRGRDTKPELIVRRIAHGLGLPLQTAPQGPTRHS